MKPTVRAFMVAAVAAAGFGPVAAVAWPGGVAAGAVPRAAGRITTVVGGIGGPGPGRTFAAPPCDVAFTGGHVLFTDANGLLRQLGPRTGWLTTLAGGGSAGDGGLAVDAGLGSGLCGVASDKAGDVAVVDLDDIVDPCANGQVWLIATGAGRLFGRAMLPGHIYLVATGGFCGRVAFDQAGNLVRSMPHQVSVVAARPGTFYGQAMTAGGSYVIAGTEQGGPGGFSGDGGPATAAMLNDPSGVAVDAAGNVLIADSGNSRIRVVAESSGTFYGVAMTTGDIYTIAGQRGGGYYGDGGPAIHAGLCDPGGLALDRAGNVLLADTCSDHIRVITVRAGRFYGQTMKAGFIYSVAGGPPSRDGGPAGRAGLSGPGGVAMDGAGNVLIADAGNSRLRVVAERSGRFYGRAMTTGHIYDVAGNGQQSLSSDGGPAVTAEFGAVTDIADGPLGTLVGADYIPYAAPLVRLVPSKSGVFFGRKMTRGHVYAIAGGGSRAVKNGGSAAGAISVDGVAFDAHGNALIADHQADRVWAVAARTGQFYGYRMTAGHIYAIAGTGRQGYAITDGGWPAKVNLRNLSAVTTDRFGDIVITENGALLPLYRLISRVLIVAARTGRFYHIAMRAGHIYNVAGAGRAGDGPNGWPALHARINARNVAADQAGNLLLAEPDNNNIRVVARASGSYYGQPMTAGHLYTVAGDGMPGFAGDGGPAAQAELARPAAAAPDPAGNVLVADTDNNRIRVVAARNGTFYGVPMTAGDIYTIAGDGTPGFAGDGGPALAAELNGPGAITDASGGVLISDNSRLRLITS